MVGACSQNAPPPAFTLGPVDKTECVTASASVSFDFEGASQSRCVINGPREFSVIISPEHALPINPSPWYAFRYAASGVSDLTVHLRYLASKHRYRPKWRSGANIRILDAEAQDDGKTASLVLPAGQAIISAQELVGTTEYDALLTRIDLSDQVERLTLGKSHDGRPIEALHIGDANAAKLVILLGRQHPPEVSGAIAMESFLEAIVALAEEGRLDTERFQVLAVPLLNPDGVVRGHWRANLGGKDLNRDWGEFTQPETRAVASWLEELPATVRPVAMVDFHSTMSNLFYVQGEEANEAQQRFLARWLAGQESSIPGYPFTVERRNANPNAGTAKNWFHAKYGIPAYTYEVGDETHRAIIIDAANLLAIRFVEALQHLSE